MAIDDLPSECARKQLEMEDLGRPASIVSSLPGIGLKAIGALLSGDITQVADLFTQFQDALESDRSSYLIGCIVEDLKKLRIDLEKLTSEQQAYLDTDWVPLLMDADKKARATRAKTRIERISNILCASIRILPAPAADQTEEMMRIATELTDEDVFVLNGLATKQLRDTCI